MIDILKIVFVFTAVLLAIRRVPLSVALLAGSAGLALLFHLPPPRIGRIFLSGVLDRETLLLIASLLLILFFSAVMKETGTMGRSISALRSIFRDARATVAIIPAIIGLVPMMGGAMLSAPLVMAASDDLKLSPERRTFLNFWFRHVWEYTLPTFPMIILVSTIVQVPLAQLCLINLPLTLASITLGIFLGFRGVSPFSPPSASPTRRKVIRNLSLFLANLLPFFLVLFLTLYFRVHLAYSMALISLLLVLLFRLPPTVVGRLWKESFSLELVFLVLGIMIFKEMLGASGALNSLTAELSRMSMPPAVLVVILPMALAVMTGFSVAFLGLSLPVLLPIFQTQEPSLPYVMLAYCSGLCAHLLSPMHACLVMTREYFQADASKVYRLLTPPVGIIFLTGLIVFLIFLWWG